MKKFILWSLAVLIGLPVLLATFLAFVLFIFFPLQHKWNVYRADAGNDRAWEEADARIVTVAIDILSAGETETATTDIACYRKHWAKPLGIKSGAPSKGISPTSVRTPILVTKLATGGIAEVRLSSACIIAFEENGGSLPRLKHVNRAFIGAPGLPSYCWFSGFRLQDEDILFETTAVTLSYPRIIAIEERPLRSVANRPFVGSSDVNFRPWPRSNHQPVSFSGQQGKDLRSARWDAERSCWSSRSDQCDQELTRYCGANPRTW